MNKCLNSAGVRNFEQFFEMLRSLCEGEYIETITVDVTPQFAKWIVENRMAPNRTASGTQIETYQRDIDRGRWLYTHQGCGFRKSDGLGFDLQHRMKACAAGTSPIRVLFAFNVPDESMCALDMGLVRRLKDVFELLIASDVEARRVQAIMRGVHSLAYRRLAKFSFSDTASLWASYEEGVRWGLRAMPASSGRGRLASSSIVSAFVFARPADPPRVEDLAVQILSGGGEAGDPILLARDRITSGAWPVGGCERARVDTSRRVLRSITAALDGEQLQSVHPMDYEKARRRYLHAFESAYGPCPIASGNYPALEVVA